MLLKKTSKPAKSGFKRKKIAPLGSLKDLKVGSKPSSSALPAFASGTSSKFRPQSQPAP